MVWVNLMEGMLCSCNKENEEVPQVLGSPLVLYHNVAEGPYNTFHTPLTLGSSSSTSSGSSSISNLVEVVENGDVPVENKFAIYIPDPTTTLIWCMINMLFNPLVLLRLITAHISVVVL